MYYTSNVETLSLITSLDDNNRGNPDSRGERIYFRIFDPEGNYEYHFSNLRSKRYFTIPITFVNYVEWSFHLLYECLNTDALVFYTIYLVK